MLLPKSPFLMQLFLYNHSKSKFATLNINKSLTSHSQLQNPHRTIQCLSFKLNFILSPTKVRNHYFLVNFNHSTNFNLIIPYFPNYHIPYTLTKSMFNHKACQSNRMVSQTLKQPLSSLFNTT